MTPADRARRLAEIIEIGIALTSEPDLSRLLCQILSAARRFSGAEAGSLYLREGDGLRFAVVQNDVLAARVGEAAVAPLIGAEALPLDHSSLAGYVALTGEVLNVPDAYALPADRPFAFNPEIDRRTGYRTRSMLGVPLRDPSGQVLGVLQLLNACDRRHRIVRFDPNVEDLVRSLASHAAVALRNARLLAESEARERSAAALAGVGRLLSQTLDVERVGQQIVDSVRSLVAAKSALLFWREPDSGNLVSVAVSDDVAGVLGLNVVFPPGGGAVGRAVLEREPVMTLDIMADAGIRQTPEMRTSLTDSADRAVLAVPLLVKTAAIGALSLHDRTGRRFTPEEVRLAQAFADHAAIALDNARLFREHVRLLVETRRQHQEAIALESVAREITSTLKVKDILQRIVERARELCRSDLAVLARYDRGAGVANVVAVAGGRTDALASLVIVPGASVEGLVIETGEVFETADYLHDARVPGAGSEALVAEGVVTEVVVPLRFRGATAGVLLVANRTRQLVTRGHVAVLGRLADQAAISLENARLHEETQQRLRHTETLLAVSEAVGSTLDVTEVFRRTVRELVRALGADAGGAWIVTADRRQVLPVAGYHLPKELVSLVTPAPVPPDPLFLRALALEEPLFVEDSPADPRFGHPWARLVPHRSALVCPMRVKDETIGAVSVVWSQERHVFTDDERRVVKAIARQAGVAMEHARLLENVERLHRQNELILDSAGDGIYGVDRHGITTFVNAAAAKMTGWSPEELVGQAMHPMIHHSQPDGSPCPAEACVVHAVLADGAPRYAGDDALWRKDGTSFVAEYLVTAIVERGEIAGAVIMFRDLTDLKQSELARREAETLRSLTGLARSAAHEIGNPLNVVRAHLELLAESLDRETADKRIRPAVEAVDRIHEILRRLNR